MIAMLWGFRDPVCAQALDANVDTIAEYWADRARNSTRIAAALDGMLSTGGWVTGIAVHAPLVLVIAEHHIIGPMRDRQNADAIAAEAASSPETFTADGTPAEPWTPPNTPPTQVADPAAEAAAAARAQLIAEQAAADGLTGDPWTPPEIRDQWPPAPSFAVPSSADGR
jgi:hypothetical protein